MSRDNITRALARLLDATYLDTPPGAHQVEMWREAAADAQREHDALRAELAAARERIAEAEAGHRTSIEMWHAATIRADAAQRRVAELERDVRSETASLLRAERTKALERADAAEKARDLAQDSAEKWKQDYEDALERVAAAEKRAQEAERKLYGTDSFNAGALGEAAMWQLAAQEAEARERALRDENARLREAMEKIAKGACELPLCRAERCQDGKIARAALSSARPVEALKQQLRDSQAAVPEMLADRTPINAQPDAGEAKCRGCPHPPHLGLCTRRNGQTAWACGCSQQTPRAAKKDEP